jgi:hypothetical protein
MRLVYPELVTGKGRCRNRLDPKSRQLFQNLIQLLTRQMDRFPVFYGFPDAGAGGARP